MKRKKNLLSRPRVPRVSPLPSPSPFDYVIDSLAEKDIISVYLKYMIFFVNLEFEFFV